MSYEREELMESYNPGQLENHYWLLAFTHDDTPKDTNARRFVRALKQEDEQAVKQARNLLLAGLRGIEWKVRDLLHCRYIVAAPGHKQGGASGSSEDLCAAAAGTFPWLEWLPGALIRTNDVPRSRGARPPHRPTLQDHLDTIHYTGPKLGPATDAFLLFDDVLASGSTTAACRAVLQEQTGTDRVIGVYLARVFGSFSGPLYDA